MDEFGEGIGNPFDTPIPGQSLTDEPGNYPWEHPPTYVTTDGAADHLWNRMSEPEFAEQIIAMLDAGVPVEAICLLYTSPSPRDLSTSRMPSSA